MAEAVARTKIRGRKRVDTVPISQQQLEKITAQQNAAEKPDALDRLVSPPKLDARMPLATRKQQLTLLSHTDNGQLVFQGRVTGTIIVTDEYGFRIGGPHTGKQLVFNGTPEDLRRTRTRTKFIIGEVIFAVRPMSRHRKVYAGVVQGFDAKGVVMDVLGATGKAAFNQARTLSDGQVVHPYNLCFKTQEQLEMFIHKFQEDLDRSHTDFRQLKENVASRMTH